MDKLFSFEKTWPEYEKIIKYKTGKLDKASILSIVRLDAFIADAKNSLCHSVIDTESIIRRNEDLFAVNRDSGCNKIQREKSTSYVKEGRILQESAERSKRLLPSAPSQLLSYYWHLLSVTGMDEVTYYRYELKRIPSEIIVRTILL